MTDESGFDRLERLQAASAGNPDLVWLLDSVARWARDDSGAPLQRYLGLPSTRAKLRLFARDRALAQAAAEVRAANVWAASRALAAEWDAFVQRGVWRAWVDLHEPPPDASKLRAALWHATKLNGGTTISAWQLRRIVGHVFRWKCPSVPVKMEPAERSSR